MPAYITVSFTPTNEDKLRQYVAAVPVTLAKYRGEFLVKGVLETLSGNTGYEMQVILGFPTKEQATGWYNSPDYQALIPLRDAAMRSQFQLVST